MFNRMLTAQIPLVLLLAMSFITANAQAQEWSFNAKPTVAPHLHVESPSQFTEWKGPMPPLGEYDKTVFQRLRVGSISLQPTTIINFDVIKNLVHTPSFFELINQQSNKRIGRFSTFDINDAEWYFNGQGVIYLYDRHPKLCGAKFLRKLIVHSTLIQESKPHIYELNIASDVIEQTTLYRTPTGHAVVAHLPENTEVMVIGILPDLSGPTPPMLVKTSTGAKGWHRRGDGLLSLYQCN